ncbi:hypothetical protein CP533_4359 [Ophiocordyceps camponoti-saundersi (nom. inval.)]|nr:hypothetical protein CP533_4359 [Ophiocordyceps camponoti-saundersi (nom. inval.)]
MADDIDRSLLDRLQALRGTKTAPLAVPTTAREQRVAADRAETPSREDTLAARLKQLRLQDAAKDSSNVVRKPSVETGDGGDDGDDEEADAVLRTDDDTLELLLGHDDDDDDDDGNDDDDERVQALLRELSVEPPTQSQDENQQGLGQQSTPSPRVKTKPSSPPDPDPPHLESSLPSLPPSLAPLPSAPAPSADDMASRLAALRDSSSSPWTLPSVPSAQPSSAVGDRLRSRYGYTDDDVDFWCTVCLEDATLRCLGCDNDPYCSRCWREMHRGPYAAFDDRSHTAVQFTRGSGEKKVAVGAS